MIHEARRIFEFRISGVLVQFDLSSKIPLDYRTASRSDRMQHSIFSKPHFCDLRIRSLQLAVL